jgi:lysophospholipase L1-like esterase
MNKKIFLTSVISIELIIILVLISMLNRRILQTGYFSLADGNNKLLYSRPQFTVGFYKTSNNSILVNELIPNFSQKFDGFMVKLPETTITINSDGFRDKDYSVIKPNNTFRIIILGDSFTFGTGVENWETYPEILENKLNYLNNGVKYEILNFGSPGYATLQEVELFKTKGLKYNPDMIIVGYFFNDVIDHRLDVEIWQKLNEEYGINSTIEKLERYRKIYHDMNNKVQARIQDFWNNSEIPFLELDNISKAKGIKVIIFVISTFNQKHYYLLEDFAKKHNWDILKFNHTWSETLYLHSLDPHPNYYGHKLMAEQLFSYLVENHIIPLSLQELKLKIR